MSMLRLFALACLILAADFAYSTDSAEPALADNEPCDSETTAVVKALVRYVMTDGIEDFGLSGSLTDFGAVHVYSAVHESACELGDLGEDEFRLVKTTMQEHYDLARSLNHLETLEVFSVEFVGNDVARVDVAVRAYIAFPDLIDDTLFCGGIVVLSKNGDGWRYESGGLEICS